MILYGADDDVSKWVADLLFDGVIDYFGPSPKAIGHVIDGKLIAGVVYNNYFTSPDKKPISIEMSIASIDKRWASRAYLKAAFAFPFIQLRLERVHITTSVDNEGANSMVSRLGFINEGRLRKAHYAGGDSYVWSMLKDECRWI